MQIAAQKADLVERLLRAISHPTRIRILNSLVAEPASGKTVATTYGMQLSNVNYHLNKILFQRCSLVRLVDEIPRKGAHEKLFTLMPEAFTAITLGTLAYAAAGVTPADQPGVNTRTIWLSFNVDDEGREEIEDALAEFSARAETVRRRRSAKGTDGGRQLLLAATKVEFGAAADSEGAET